MPPTIQSGQRDDRERRRPGEKRSELVCRVKFNNTLPEIPFDPKFIAYPFESNRFVQYNPTSLERSYKHDLLTEHDLGVTIDLINPETYRFDPNAYLAEEDERLLEEDMGAPQDSKRSRHHNKKVTWMRKTEYISTEYNRFTQSADKVEARIGYSIKKKLKEDDWYRDRESQLDAIEATFQEAKKPIEKHYSKPGVVPVEEYPIFPDFDLWKFPCAQVIFDSDPAPPNLPHLAQTEVMSQAMIRGMKDDSGDQFVAYFLPTEETTNKRKRDFEAFIDYEPEDEYEYVMSREYNWNVKNKASRGYEETYFFVFREKGVFYNELETRVRLSKRRKTKGSAPIKSRLVVKHREQNEQEMSAQEARLMMLGPPQEEEEEEAPAEMENIEVAEGSDAEEKADKSGEEDAGSEKAASDAEGSSKSDNEDDRGSVRSGSRTPSRSGSRSRSVSRSGSGSGSGSGSDSGSERSGSGSESEAESDTEQKKAEEEIFGSASSSEDSD